ncbi:MAG: methionyl-tRNA formyltransferase [Ignavibacteria bacterium]|nr:methionyl-tRNA formyltransferase [Ignavibacteria bacterium]
MKILFFGTPEFAIPSLKILLENNYEIVAVITVPDKEKGRGLKLEPSPVKSFALENNLKVIQPQNLKDEKFLDELKNLEPDLGVIVAYRILPVQVYSIPKFGTFNLHASLLPKYRGAAPIQWALINGEKVTGVTTFFLQEKVDTGNIILQREVEINEDDDFKTLHDKLSIVGAELVLETVKRIEAGNFKTQPQNDAEATLAPKITKEICKINWNQPAIKIHNLVRGLSPIPAAFTIFNSKTFKIYKTKVTELDSNNSPGTIEIINDELLVNTSDKKISILEIQPESRKRMSIKEFLLGYKNLFSTESKFD